MDTELLELRTQRADLINKANRAIEEEKTEDANEIISQIKELDERITKVEKKVAENENNDGDNEDETGNQKKIREMRGNSEI